MLEVGKLGQHWIEEIVDEDACVREERWDRLSCKPRLAYEPWLIVAFGLLSKHSSGTLSAGIVVLKNQKFRIRTTFNCEQRLIT